MTFGNLSYLYLLWLVPALALFYVYAFLKRDRLIREFCGAELYLRLVPPLYKGRQRLKAFLLIMAVLCFVFALVRPKWGFHWEDVKRVGVDIMVAIDVSKSMLAEDVKPSRLERAKREVYDLCQMLEGDRIGLIAFAGTSFVQCPLTLDYGAFRMFLDHLSPDLIPTPGTSLGSAIRKAIESFDRQQRTSKALILITDGEDHDQDTADVLAEAKKEGIKIFAIGVGQDSGTPIPASDGSGGFLKDRRGEMVLSRLDEKALQKMAIETGGSYVRSVTGDMDLDQIYRTDIRGGVEQKELRSTRKKRWEERFQWFIALGLAMLLLEFLLREHKGSAAA